MSTFNFEPASTTVTLRIVPPVMASRRLGNGVRNVLADTAEVTTWPDGRQHVTLTGRVRKRDGTEGNRQQIGWTIGGRWDMSAEAPPVALAAVAAGASN